ncbi:MAG: hypothetical protein KA743_02520 [Geothrix sp.]|nr:hypothetical protein [Geothrix sp.]MCE1205712.1 hypothetical protein [Holophagaceae bacterium]
MTQPNAQHPWTEQEPDNLLLATVMRGTEHLSDAQLLSTLLREPDLRRAEAILCTANLNTLVHGGPLELTAHGLHEDEILRLMTHLEFTSRVIAQRRSNCLASLEDTVREIRIRGEQRQRSCVGMFAMDCRDRILVDKVLFEGGVETCSVDVAEILRETLRVGANALVVYRWTAIPNAEPGPSDKWLANMLRVASTVLGITILDVLVVAERSYWSGRINDNWQDAEPKEVK